MRHFICALLSVGALNAWALPTVPHDLKNQPQCPSCVEADSKAAVAKDIEQENLLHLASLGGSFSQTGVASMYDEPQGIACGPGRFNPNALTAAHKTLPCWSKVRVTSLATGRSVVVTINDRGPYVAGRIIDLSRASFNAIGTRGAGLMRVRVEALGSGGKALSGHRRHHHHDWDEYDSASN